MYKILHNHIFINGSKMINPLYIFFLLFSVVLACSGINAQSREDFSIETTFKDTLVHGIRNEIQIRCKNCDPSEIRISAEGISLITGNDSGIYYAYCPNHTKKPIINLYYRNETKDTLLISCHFTGVALSESLANRILRNSGLEPMDTPADIARKKKLKELNLVVPPVQPDFYSPIIVSKNKRYALLGNTVNANISIMDLSTRKLILSTVADSLGENLYLLESDMLLSNTGRYIYNGYYEFDGNRNIKFLDIFNKKYVFQYYDPSKFEYVALRDFSSDDSSFLDVGGNSKQDYLIHGYIHSGVTREFAAHGNSIIDACFIDNDEKISVISIHGEDSVTLTTPVSEPGTISESITYYINEIDIKTGNTVLKDSLYFENTPYKFQIEHEFILFSFFKPGERKLKVMIYDLKNGRMKYSIEEELYFSKVFKDIPPFFSLDPDLKYLLIGKATPGYITIFHLYDLVKGKQETNPWEFNTGTQSGYSPILLPDNTVFGVYIQPRTYIGESLEKIFWFNHKFQKFEHYEPQRIMDIQPWVVLTSIPDSATGISNNQILLETYQLKNNGNSSKKMIPFKPSEINSTTIRLVSKIIDINTYTDLNKNIFELDLAKLSYQPVLEFPKFTIRVESNAFTYGIDSNPKTKLNIYDSIAINDMGYNNNLLAIIKENRLIYTSEMSNTLRFYNLDKKNNSERTVNFLLLDSDEWMYYTNDKYYAYHFKKIPFFQYSLENKVFPFEQFDLKYNRPDIILDRLGYADSLTVASYHSAYLKRLKKMGFTEDMLKDDFHLPEIMIRNFALLPSITDSAEIDLDFEIVDTKYKLDRINVLINDVPVYGTSGIDLRQEDKYKLEKSVKLALTEGENKIQVSVLNQAGAESYKETVYITKRPDYSKLPDLYLITIGAGKYADARYDLTYASKDARDIQSSFEKKKSIQYGRVFTYSFTDEKVTRESILNLKSELLKAKRDDVVMITVAGHGILDKELNYYLATYDMDFSDPAAMGLAYEDLESLMDGIAPLRKVLFIDACHSGEVDKDEMEQIAGNTVTTGPVKFRNAGAGIQKKNLGLKTTSELMNELFTDLRKGTGATVISSAGGAEFAMESDEWKNGLFTYCLLHGLKDKAADTDKNGEIMLSELQAYLRKEVTELSNGAQQPTSRIENLSMDFRIW